MAIHLRSEHRSRRHSHHSEPAVAASRGSSATGSSRRSRRRRHSHRSRRILRPTRPRPASRTTPTIRPANSANAPRPIIASVETISSAELWGPAAVLCQFNDCHPEVAESHAQASESQRRISAPIREHEGLIWSETKNRVPHFSRPLREVGCSAIRTTTAASSPD